MVSNQSITEKEENYHMSLQLDAKRDTFRQMYPCPLPMFMRKSSSIPLVSSKTFDSTTVMNFVPKTYAEKFKQKQLSSHIYGCKH